jgi:hypothetical protein
LYVVFELTTASAKPSRLTSRRLAHDVGAEPEYAMVFTIQSVVGGAEILVPALFVPHTRQKYRPRAIPPEMAQLVPVALVHVYAMLEQLELLQTSTDPPVVPDDVSTQWNVPDPSISAVDSGAIWRGGVGEQIEPLGTYWALHPKPHVASTHVE